PRARRRRARGPPLRDPLRHALRHRRRGRAPLRMQLQHDASDGEPGHVAEARDPGVHHRRPGPRYRLRLLRQAIPDRPRAPPRPPRGPLIHRTFDHRSLEGESLMRALAPVPDEAIDPVTRLPRFGSYKGGLPRVDLTPVTGGALRRITRRK